MDTKDTIITLKKAAELLHIAPATVYRLVHSGDLKAFRLFRSWRTSEQACNEFINKQLNVISQEDSDQCLEDIYAG